jgi:flavin-dependent dehydrogenase
MPREGAHCERRWWFRGGETGAPGVDLGMQLEARCCIVGGGPAGMILGWLLARAGVDVIVLEKHADLWRDFRGDTVHPSTLELMHELGVLEEFLRVPHTRMDGRTSPSLQRKPIVRRNSFWCRRYKIHSRYPP